MNTKKIIAILALAVTMTSSFFLGETAVYAAERTNNDVFSEGIGQANIPNLQESMGQNMSYYYNGFPSRVEIENKEFDAENAVFDYVEPFADRDYSNITIPSGDAYDDLRGVFEDMKVKAYITVDNKVVETYQEALRAVKRKGLIREGERVMSIVLDKDSPYLKDIKVQRHTYYDILRDENLAPGQSSSIQISRTYGVTNQEAYSIAKTVGIKFDAGLGFSKGPLSLDVSTSLERSLTETFSSNYSISDSTNETYTHNFGQSDKTRRVALYQYIESYKACPIINDEYVEDFSSKVIFEHLIPAENTNYKTNRIQTVSITNKDQ